MKELNQLLFNLDNKRCIENGGKFIRSLLSLSRTLRRDTARRWAPARPHVEPGRARDTVQRRCRASSC